MESNRASQRLIPSKWSSSYYPCICSISRYIVFLLAITGVSSNLVLLLCPSWPLIPLAVLFPTPVSLQAAHRRVPRESFSPITWAADFGAILVTTPLAYRFMCLLNTGVARYLDGTRKTVTCAGSNG